MKRVGLLENTTKIWSKLTVDAIAAGTLKMTLMTALRFNTMKTVAIKFDMNLSQRV
jgi:hypothetical protein